MAIIQISKIQHRRGLNTDLPQLASAELGWSIDTRQLYIGNGTIEEGAPTLGNTEILTQYSDILSLVQTYNFKGVEGGYKVNTGATSAIPVTRTLQNKLDDIINIRDFGAKGDGVTNDLPAINRALNEIFCRAPNNTLSRRTIHFPGGTYIISGGTVNIPTYANIVGDGSGKTFIVQTDATQDCVLKTADSAQQIDSNIGSNGATLPTSINISGMTIYNTATSKNVFNIVTSTFINCTDVNFTGAQSAPSSPGTTTAISLKSLTSPSPVPTTGINFARCAFTNITYGVVVDDSNISNVTFAGCLFYNLYRGIKLGELTALDPRPTGFRISSSVFDKIYNSAIATYSLTKGIYSIGNRFMDVGNSRLGAGNAGAAVIQFWSDDSMSIGDQFDRTGNDILSYPLIDRGLGLGGPSGLSQGRNTIGSGVTATLADNTASVTAVTSFTVTNAIVEYSITRGSALTRNGIMKINSSPLGVFYDDEYHGTDCGVTLSVAQSGSTQTLNYITTSTGTAATLTYSIKYFS